MIKQIVRGPLLAPSADGSVAFHAQGALAFDERGILLFAGAWENLRSQLPADSPPTRISRGVILPPLLDLHTHIPQHPIRGRFAEGVSEGAPGGRLLNSLKRNVFPAEAKCNATDHGRAVIESFATDVLANGIIGGAAFMTVSAEVTEMALEILPATWSVGLVLMNQNCPQDLRTDEINLDANVARIAGRFGRRLIVTDRFAVATNTPLRRAGSRLAGRFGLRTQTHLNEQTQEKHLVERELYPEASSYTDVYRGDGLLDHQAILAHCIHMRPDEWQMLVSNGAAIAHCPTSNFLLGSGLMPLDRVLEHKIPFAIATDMGASPTVSMLAEIKRFLQVHSGRSSRATPSEALWRATISPSRILGLEQIVGRLEPGRPASFIEVEPAEPASSPSADEVIRSLLPSNIDNPRPTILRVTLGGKTAFESNGRHA
ncbi:MAG: amidohydrolase family protein [Tepidisphaeraceae bacterium]